MKRTFIEGLSDFEFTILVFFMRKLSAKKFEWSKDTNSFVPRAEGLISTKRAKLKTHKKCSVVFNECEKFQHQDYNQDFFCCPPFEWCRYRWRITCPPRIYLTPLAWQEAVQKVISIIMWWWAMAHGSRILCMTSTIIIVCHA